MKFLSVVSARRIVLAVWLLTMSGFSPAQQSGSDLQSLNPLEVAEAIAVTTRPLSELWFEQTLRSSAVAVSLNHSQISAQATGEVLSIDVETGNLVDQGAVLVRLDCRQSEFNQAVLDDAYELALKDYQRSQSLQKKNAIAEQQLTQASSTLEQARIRRQQAELSVEHCLIVAPFTGVVTRRQIQLGAVAIPGSPILKLLQTDAVEVRVRLNRDELLSLWAANSVEFQSEGQNYPLIFRSALPIVDSVSNKRAVRLSILGEAPFPGAPGDVVWKSEGRFLPVDLVVQRNNSLGYFVEAQGIARYIVLPGARLGHPARIEPEPENPDAIKVVVEGRFRLEDGSRIQGNRVKQ